MPFLLIVFIGMLATLIGSLPAAAEVEGIVYLLRDFRNVAVFIDLDVCTAASSELSGTRCEVITIEAAEAILRERQPYKAEVEKCKEPSPGFTRDRKR